MISRRGFLARLVAAPVIALTVLRAPARQGWIDDLISFKPVSQESLGISIRYIQQFDVTADHNVTRFDVLYGVANLSPELAVRITDELPWWNPRRWL
jgi:P22 coat protein - gene protein 5